MTVTFLSKTLPTSQNDFQPISAAIPFVIHLRYPLQITTYNVRTSTLRAQDYSKKPKISNSLFPAHGKRPSVFRVFAKNQPNSLILLELSLIKKKHGKRRVFCREMMA